MRATMNANERNRTGKCTPRWHSRLVAAGALAVLLAAAAPGPRACGPKQPAGKIKVTVVVILASDRPGEVDPRLKCIADEVRKKDPSLQSFHLASMTCRSLAANEEAAFKLVEDQSAQVVVHHGADGENRVSLAVTPPRQGEIVYRTVCGKFLPIVTRYQTKNRDRLILAVRVQPCTGK
jgi:hypothetical protein